MRLPPGYTPNVPLQTGTGSPPSETRGQEPVSVSGQLPEPALPPDYPGPSLGESGELGSFLVLAQDTRG